MGILDRFEHGVERVVNTAFAKAFRSEVKPVELASALRREVDDRAAVVGRDRTVVPNEFTLELSPGDYDQVEAWGAEALRTSSRPTSRSTRRASGTRSSAR